MPSGSAIASAMPSAAPESSSCSSAFVREEAGVVADEAERLDERVRVGGVGEDHARLRSPTGHERAAEQHERRVADERERDGERARPSRSRS